jgi:hypothetical protein
MKTNVRWPSYKITVALDKEQLDVVLAALEASMDTGGDVKVRGASYADSCLAHTPRGVFAHDVDEATRDARLLAPVYRQLVALWDEEGSRASSINLG